MIEILHVALKYVPGKNDYIAMYNFSQYEISTIIELCQPI